MSIRRTGKTLIEVLVIMVGTSAVLTTAGQLLHRVSRAERAVRDSAAAGRAETRFVRMFREDVRGSQAASLADGSLRLDADHARVEYVATQGVVERTLIEGGKRARDAYRLGEVAIEFTTEGRFAVATVEPLAAPARHTTPAGRFQVVAEIAADRIGIAVESNPPAEAPQPEVEQ